jgi:demethylmenaquinone methyltransferase/2-methoxy-6-polyprenyl-1,4-benzoquinol methylase
MGRKEKEMRPEIHKKKQRKYFNEQAENWDQEVFHDPTKLKKIIKELALKPGDKVLDVGTGTGIMLKPMFQKVTELGKIVAIDISKNMIAIAKKKHPPAQYPNINFITGDVEKYGFEETFNAILCYSCYPHFHHKGRLIQVLAAILEPQGKVMIAHSQSRKAINKLHKEKEHIVRHDKLPTMNIIFEMLRNADLRVHKSEDTEEIFFVMGKKG